MLLAMDAGNTHIVFGCMDAGELRRSFRAPTRPGRSREESLAELRGSQRVACREHYFGGVPLVEYWND